MPPKERERLPFRRAVVVEPVRNLQQIVINFLHYFRVGNVFTCTNPVEAIEFIRSNDCDLVICGSDKGAGIVLASVLRNASDSPNRRIPIVLLEKAPDEMSIEKARASGINAILAVPVSAMALGSRLKALANDNLPFVCGQTYVGPERRRLNRPFSPPDRRVAEVGKPAEFLETAKQKFVRYINEHMPPDRHGKDGNRKVIAATLSSPKKQGDDGAGRKGAEPGIPVDELQAGMVLARACKTKSGLAIVGAGDPISQRTLLRLVDMVRAGEIEDNFVIAQ